MRSGSSTRQINSVQQRLNPKHNGALQHNGIKMKDQIRGQVALATLGELSPQRTQRPSLLAHPHHIV